jgi:hypothetical protein
MMALTRRDFNRSILTGSLALATVGTSIELEGCNAVSNLENWIPVALTAVSAIVKLLGPVVPAPVAVAITLIQAGFSALLTAIQNYKAGTGVLADIANAIAAVESAFQSFFSSLNIPTALLDTIEGLASIIISTIQAFANEITPTSVVTSLAIGGTRLAVAPVKRNPKQFKDSWNAECAATHHPEARI